MTLGRLIRGLGTTAISCSIVRVTVMTKLFDWGDVVSFLVQATGAGMTASGGCSMADSGRWVVIAGLVI
jgi:hypothetical protein